MDNRKLMRNAWGIIKDASKELEEKDYSPSLYEADLSPMVIDSSIFDRLRVTKDKTEEDE